MATSAGTMYIEINYGKVVTDDRFVLVIDEADAAFDTEAVRKMLQEFHVLAVEERVTLAGGDLQ